MHLQRIHVPEEEADHFFAYGTFHHESILYKIAIAEKLTGDGETTGSFEVLLQSQNGTVHLSLYKWEESWINNSETADIDVDIVLTIGGVIDEIRPRFSS